MRFHAVEELKRNFNTMKAQMFRRTAHSMPRMILIILLVLGFDLRKVEAQDNYQRAYNNIAEGISTAEGQALLTFNRGVWTTDYLNTKVSWTFDAPLGKDPQATSVFDYENHVLRSAKITFDPAVLVKITKDTSCLAIRVTDITYGILGNITNINFQYDNSACKAQLSSYLYKHLQLSPSPDLFFKGKPFASLAFGVQSSNSALLNKIQFFPGTTSGGVPNPALLASLSENTEISISSVDKWVIEEGSVQFTFLEYDVASQAADGRLDKLHFKLATGKLHAGNSVFAFASDDVIDFESAYFSKNKAAFDLTNGTFHKSSLRDGSSIEIASSNGTQSYVSFGAGTTATLNGITVSVSYANSGDTFEFVSVDTGSFDLVTRSGEVHFAGDNFVKLGQGNCHLEITEGASWGSTGGTHFHGAISSLSTSLTGGALKINTDTKLLIASGQLDSDNVGVDTDNDNPVTAVISNGQVALESGTTLGEPGKFQISASGGNVIFATPQTPLDLTSKNPKGVINLRLNVSSGDVALDSLGHVSLIGGGISGTFSTGVGNSLAGNVSVTTNNANEINVGPSNFVIDGVNTISVASGHLEASNLHQENDGLSGTVSRMHLNLSSGTFRETGAFEVKTNDHGIIDIDGTGAPFTFAAGQSKPAGAFYVYLPVRDGTAFLGKAGCVAILGDYIEANITMIPGQPIQGVGKVSLVVGKGVFQLNGGSSLNVQSGIIKSNSLAFDQSSGITGPFDNVQFSMTASTFAVPNGITASFQDGGTFIANDPTSPLRLMSNGKVAIGRFAVNADLDHFSSAATHAFVISQGHIALQLEQSIDGAIFTPTGENCTVQNAHLYYTGNQGARFEFVISLTNGKMTAAQPPKFNADLTGSLINCVLHVEAPPAVGDGNKRMFKLMFDAGFDATKDNTFSIPKFGFQGDQLAGGLNIPLNLKLTVPQGDGEHPNSDVNEDGNHGGPDWAKNAQEAFTDTEGGVTVCRVHIYLLPSTYTLKVNLDFTSTGSDQTIKVDHIDIDPPIVFHDNDPTKGGWGRDGCDSFLLKAISAGIVSILVGDPLLGAGLVTEISGLAEDHLDKIGDAKIASFLQAQQFTLQKP